MLHVGLISVERSIAIFYPFKHQLWLTKKGVAVFLVTFWISWTLITVFTQREHGGGFIGYSRMGFVTFGAIFMLVLNFRLWIEVRRHSRQIQAALPSQSISEEENTRHTRKRAEAKTSRDFKAAKTILLIIGLLLLCNLPLIATFSARN